MHELVQEASQLEAVQVASFVGDHFVLTIHEGAHSTIDNTRVRWAEMAEGLHREPMSLVYVLMDVMVDNYQSITEDLENTIEDLEDITLSLIDLPMRERMRATSMEPNQRRFYEVKQRASRLRRYVTPVGAICDALLSEPIRTRVPDKIEELLADVQDHVRHVGDQIRNVDELTEAMLELRRAEQATALNEVTKRLTGWAAIIAVPTLVSSVYGMNFALLPTEGSFIGFWFALALMALTGFFLYLLFKRHHWI
jgi:magnesium transporter